MKKTVFALTGVLLVEIILVSLVLRPKNHFYNVDIINKTVTIFNYDKNCTFRYLMIKNFNQTMTQTNIEVDYKCINDYPMEYEGNKAEVSTIELEKITPVIHIYTEKENYKFSLFNSHSLKTRGE
jgi:hypothetical protein